MNTQPNILFITSDQQNPNALGIFDRRFRTPNLDRLAGEGTTFTRSYASSPLCTPARATWVTGQYPFTHGAWSVGTNLRQDCLKLPELLADGGYRTAMIGKSHLQASGQPGFTEGAPESMNSENFRNWTGPWYGFQYAQINIGHVDESHSASMHYRAWLEDHGVDIDRYFRKKGDRNIGPCWWELPERYHPSSWAAEKAITYLRDHAKNHQQSPFYLNLNFPEPHRPFKAPMPWYERFSSIDPGKPKRRWGEWEDKTSLFRAYVDDTLSDLGLHDQVMFASLADSGRFAREEYTNDFSAEEADRMRVYAAMVGLMDDKIGRVLDTLEELGLSENTFVLFVSDHGDLLGDHFLWSKGILHYDGCLRVPTIARWPGRVPAGEQTSALLSNVDYAPTFLQLAGLPVDARMQGIGQIETCRNPGEALRRGVLVDHRAEKGLYVNSWVTDRYRLSVYHLLGRSNEIELFDLQEDPEEFINLAAEGGNRGLALDLMADMLAERSSVNLAWQPRPCYA